MRCTRYWGTTGLSLITIANAAKISSKPLISFSGEPGRTRTSNQAVMSALPYPTKSGIIGIFEHVRRRLFAFGCRVSLVIYWSNAKAGDLEFPVTVRHRLRA
jgi:hypothetical protein